MKKSIFTIAIILTTIVAQAKIWRCNNNFGVTADFTTLNAAVVDASVLTGDTIHLEPSLTSYGDATISTKKLTVISTGSFLSDNLNLQFDSKAGFCGNLTVNGAATNGTVISVRFNGGLFASGVSTTNIKFVNCASIISSSNYCNASNGAIYISGADNCIISKCWAAWIGTDGGANNLVVTNNIIGNGISIDVSGTAIVSNNVIHAINVDNGCVTVNIQNSVISNNIFLKGISSASFQNSIVKNNLCSATTGQILPAGNGNVNGVDMTTVFVDGTGVFIDNAYILKAGSPAIGAGEAGVDCGAFGNVDPYRLAAQAAIPSIYKLVVPASPTGNTMNILFSTRSNN